MARRKNPHRGKQRKDKKLLQLEQKYADEMRQRGMHVEKRTTQDGIVIAAVPNPVRTAPWKPNVKGMRWQDGKLVPRKGGPK